MFNGLFLPPPFESAAFILGLVTLTLPRHHVRDPYLKKIQHGVGETFIFRRMAMKVITYAFYTRLVITAEIEPVLYPDRCALTELRIRLNPHAAPGQGPVNGP